MNRFSEEKLFPCQSQPLSVLLITFVLFFVFCFISFILLYFDQISWQQYCWYIIASLFIHIFFLRIFINFKISNLNACNKIIIIILLLSVASRAWMSSKWLAVSRMFVTLPAIFFSRGRSVGYQLHNSVASLLTVKWQLLASCPANCVDN